MLTATTGQFVSALVVVRPAGALFVCGEERPDLAAECDSEHGLRGALRTHALDLDCVDRSRGKARGCGEHLAAEPAFASGNEQTSRRPPDSR
jgi:hypothetical protein